MCKIPKILRNLRIRVKVYNKIVNTNISVSRLWLLEYRNKQRANKQTNERTDKQTNKQTSVQKQTKMKLKRN